MSKISLGVERPDFSSDRPEPAKPKKMKTVFPSLHVEKSIGMPLKFGQEFTANVKFRVTNISDGEEFNGERRRTRITLDAISIEPQGKAVTPKSRRDEDGTDPQNAIEDALTEQVAKKG